SETTRLRFAGPAITRSIASSTSSIEIALLSCLAATIAASLSKFSKSAPENPGVLIAITFKSTSDANVYFARVLLVLLVFRPHPDYKQVSVYQNVLDEVTLGQVYLDG